MRDQMTDEILRTYDVLEQIGEGSGGIVFKAYHRRLQKMVVLKKIIDPNYSADRNRQEVDILKNINHSCPMCSIFSRLRTGSIRSWISSPANPSRST